ncbi:MAG: hypothetical protein QXR63_02060 [Candidatus Bathyarchaeia archaeon]
MQKTNFGSDIKERFSRGTASSSKFHNRIPTVVAVIVGFLVGFLVDGAVGVVVAMVAGMLVLKVFGRLKIPVQPWQSLVAFLLPIVGRTLLILGLLLPFGNGLTLSTGEYPDTLPKYFSIVVLKPQNLMATSGKYWGMPDYYPGAPLIVLVSIILMFVGSLRMQKMKYALISVAGLLLFTLSPTISYLISTGNANLLFYMPFFQVGFYLAWIGVVLVILHNLLHNRLSKGTPATPSYGKFTLALIFPVAAGTQLLEGLMSIYINLPTVRMLIDISQDFEELHHSFANGFSGIVSGIGAGEIVDEFPEEVTEVPEEAPVYEVPPVYEGPVPSTDPNDPPGTTFQYNSDGTITKNLPDGTVGTKYTDGTIYAESPDGSTYTSYPDGTEKVYTPDGTLETTYPDGTVVTNTPDGKVETSYPDGTSVIKAPDGRSLTTHPDGKITISNPDGSSETFTPDGETVSKTFGGDMEGVTATKNPDGTWTVTSTYGGSMTVDKKGNISGSITDKDGTQCTFLPDGTRMATKPNEGTVTIHNDGSMSVQTADGSKISADSKGNITEGHFELNDGRTVDVSSSGDITVQDNQANSAVIKQDGSIDYTDQDGTKINANPDGSGSFSTPEGYSGVANPDGTTTVNYPNGSSATMNPDGSLTLKSPEGQTTTISAQELKGMEQ